MNTEAELLRIQLDTQEQSLNGMIEVTRSLIELLARLTETIGLIRAEVINADDERIDQILAAAYEVRNGIERMIKELGR